MAVLVLVKVVLPIETKAKSEHLENSFNAEHTKKSELNGVGNKLFLSLFSFHSNKLSDCESNISNYN